MNEERNGYEDDDAIGDNTVTELLLSIKDWLRDGEKIAAQLEGLAESREREIRPLRDAAKRVRRAVRAAVKVSASGGERSSSWTPERRAAQSERLKRVHTEKRAAS